MYRWIADPYCVLACRELITRRNPIRSESRCQRMRVIEPMTRLRRPLIPCKILLCGRPGWHAKACTPTPPLLRFGVRSKPEHHVRYLFFFRSSTKVRSMYRSSYNRDVDHVFLIYPSYHGWADKSLIIVPSNRNSVDRQNVTPMIDPPILLLIVLAGRFLKGFFLLCGGKSTMRNNH